MHLRSALLWAACAIGVPACAVAHDPAPTPLSFSDFYKHPVGPRGLEASDTLLGLSGARVRLVGFAVRGTDAVILAPMPLVLGDEDESLADDLPPSIAYVDTSDERLLDTMRGCVGPIAVTGQLETGPRREADTRISFVRLHAEAVQCAPATRGRR